MPNSDFHPDFGNYYHFL